MTSLIFLIIIGLWIVVFIKVLDLIYLFQIKEYRRDRFFAFLKEEGIGKSLYFNENRHWPKKSLRNLIIALFSLTVLFPLFFFSLRLNLSFSLNLVWLSFLIAPIIVGLGTALTAPLAAWTRKKTILRAKKIVNQSSAVFIAITGSYGKTSTKEFLYRILKEKYRVERSKKNYNSAVGIALSIIQNLTRKTQFFIVEMGAYRRGEIDRICRLTQPRYGIITAIGNQHQALFGSQQELINSKKELVEALPAKGLLYINQQIKPLKSFVQSTRASVVYFSPTKKNNQTDIYLDNVQINHQGSRAVALYKGKKVAITTTLLGSHNLVNLLAPIGLSLDLGLTVKQVEAGIKKIKPLPGKLSLHQGPNKSLILNDTANSNLQGFLAALKTASLFQGRALIVVSKGIVELGGEKKNAYRKIINALRSANGLLYTSDPLFKQLAAEKDSIIIFNDEKKLYNSLSDKLNRQTILLAEGRFSKNFLSCLHL